MDILQVINESNIFHNFWQSNKYITMIEDCYWKKNVYQSKYSLFTVFVWIIIYHDYVNDDAIIIIIIIKLEEKKSFPMWLEKKSKV